jgi:hypothetical protein
MAIAVQQIRPIAHLPLVLGVLRRLEAASLIDDLIPHSLNLGSIALLLRFLASDDRLLLFQVWFMFLNHRGIFFLLLPGRSDC